MFRSVRLWYWVGGLLTFAVAGIALGWGREGDSNEPFLLFLIWGLVGLAAEVAALLASLSRDAKQTAPFHAPPADGEVELASVEGVRTVSNARDSRYRQYTGWEGEIAAPIDHESFGRKSSPPLWGRVVLISLFIGRDGRRWSDETIAEAHASLRKSAVWIEREAIRWDARVNVDLADAYFVVEDEQDEDVAIGFVPEGDRQGPIEERAVSKALIAMSRAAGRLGFHDARDLVQRISGRIEADVHVWLVHPLRAGRSLAVPLERTEMAGVSLAVCYAREASFPEPLTKSPYSDPTTIAHELLHLFGATDKYAVPLRSFPAQSVTSRDIMRLSFDSLSRLRIDPKTAEEIGWTRRV